MGLVSNVEQKGTLVGDQECLSNRLSNIKDRISNAENLAFSIKEISGRVKAYEVYPKSESPDVSLENDLLSTLSGLDVRLREINYVLEDALNHLNVYLN